MLVNCWTNIILFSLPSISGWRATKSLRKMCGVNPSLFLLKLFLRVGISWILTQLRCIWNYRELIQAQMHGQLMKVMWRDTDKSLIGSSTVLHISEDIRHIAETLWMSSLNFFTVIIFPLYRLPHQYTEELFGVEYLYQ